MDKRLYNQLQDVIPKSQHCQRNWDLTKEVTDEQIEILKLAVTQCPSKQNNAFYWVHFVKDRELIEKLYDCTWGYYDKPVYSGKRTEDHIRRNDQCLANVLIVFEKWNNYELHSIAGYSDNEDVMTDEQNDIMNENAQQLIDRDRWMAVGIAGGYINMTAHQLGLKTGYCQCFGNPPESQPQPDIKYPEERIKNILGLKGEPLMFMGVGYANEGVEHSRGHNERTFKFNPKRKQPIVTKVWE